MAIEHGPLDGKCGRLLVPPFQQQQRWTRETATPQARLQADRESRYHHHLLRQHHPHHHDAMRQKQRLHDAMSRDDAMPSLHDEDHVVGGETRGYDG